MDGAAELARLDSRLTNMVGRLEQI